MHNTDTEVLIQIKRDPHVRNGEAVCRSNRRKSHAGWMDSNRVSRAVAYLCAIVM